MFSFRHFPSIVSLSFNLSSFPSLSFWKLYLLDIVISETVSQVLNFSPMLSILFSPIVDSWEEFFLLTLLLIFFSSVPIVLLSYLYCCYCCCYLIRANVNHETDLMKALEAVMRALLSNPGEGQRRILQDDRRKIS